MPDQEVVAGQSNTHTEFAVGFEGSGGAEQPSVVVPDPEDSKKRTEVAVGLPEDTHVGVEQHNTVGSDHWDNPAVDRFMQYVV